MAGMDVQAQGVAEALGLDYEMKRVEPKGIWKVRRALGAGCAVRALRRAGLAVRPALARRSPSRSVAAASPTCARCGAGPALQTFTVVMQDPKTGLGTADMIWVPEHDRLRGANVFTTLTAPHSFTAKRLTELRRAMPPAIAALPRPRVAVVLGGKNAVYKFRDEDDARLAARASARWAGSAQASSSRPSRRTHARLLEVVDEATRAFPRILWDGAGANPYGDFLAHADLFVVTADSVNMTGEACATGRPVLVFTPVGRLGEVPPLPRGAASARRHAAAARSPRRDSAIGATSRCIPSTRSRARSSGAGWRARDARAGGHVGRS